MRALIFATLKSSSLQLWLRTLNLRLLNPIFPQTEPAIPVAEEHKSQVPPERDKSKNKSTCLGDVVTPCRASGQTAAAGELTANT